MSQDLHAVCVCVCFFITCLIFWTTWPFFTKLGKNAGTSFITAEFLRWVVTTRMPHSSYQRSVGKRAAKGFALILRCRPDENIKSGYETNRFTHVDWVHLGWGEMVGSCVHDQWTLEYHTIERIVHLNHVPLLKGSGTGLWYSTLNVRQTTVRDSSTCLSTDRCVAFSHSSTTPVLRVC
jgi:hypothetical protein